MEITHLIRQADESELEVVLGILDNCARDMLEHGKEYWRSRIKGDPAFTEERTNQRVLENIRKGYVYLIYDCPKDAAMADLKKAVGTITLSEEPPEYHVGRGAVDKWQVRTGKALYSGTLGVLVSQRGKGFSRELVQFRERYAREKGFSSIRIDVREKTENVLRGAPKLGFKLVHVYEKEQEKSYFFEKSLAYSGGL